MLCYRGVRRSSTHSIVPVAGVSTHLRFVAISFCRCSLLRLTRRVACASTSSLNDGMCFTLWRGGALRGVSISRTQHARSRPASQWMAADNAMRPKTAGSIDARWHAHARTLDFSFLGVLSGWWVATRVQAGGVCVCVQRVRTRWFLAVASGDTHMLPSLHRLAVHSHRHTHSLAQSPLY